MTRAPRYHASGDCIHADPLAVISPEGRTFSVYSSDSIEMNGLIAAGRNGLVFYDNDQELFLNRPLFTDILSSHPTPTQLAIINEFSTIQTWKALREFFVKLDKILVIDQFKQYLAAPEGDGAYHFFLSRAVSFCEYEGIPLRNADLACDNGFDKLVSAISAAKFLKHGVFREVIPDILQERPDALLAKSVTVKRADRWLSVAGQSGALPEPVLQMMDANEGNSRTGILREIVAKYMRELEAWENTTVMSLNGCDFSRRDAEEYLFGAYTAYCPSPLGFTPRIRYAFPAPEALADAPLDVKIAFVSALETKIRHQLGFPVKLLYMRDRHCFLLEAIGDPGGREINLAYHDGADFEHGVLFATDENLTHVSQALDAISAATVPALSERAIEDARQFVMERQEMSPDAACMEDGDTYDEPGIDESFREEMRP